MLIGAIEILRKWIIDESKRKTLKSKNLHWLKEKDELEMIKQKIK